MMRLKFALLRLSSGWSAAIFLPSKTSEREFRSFGSISDPDTVFT